MRWEVKDSPRSKIAPCARAWVVGHFTHKIDGKPFVRVTFPDGKEETVYGFNTRADAIRWIRCEAVVWLYERRGPQVRVAN